MKTQNQLPIIFISHMSADKDVSNALEELIHVAFGDTVKVFNSSNDTSITGGDDWRQKIYANLTASMAVLSVFTPDSIDRAWVNFEAGGAWVQEKTLLIPCCANGMTVIGLPSVVKNIQGYELAKSTDLEKLIRKLDERIGINPRRAAENATEFAVKFQQISTNYDEVKKIDLAKQQIADLENQKQTITKEIESLKFMGSTKKTNHSKMNDLSPTNTEQDQREIFLIHQMLRVDYDHLSEDPQQRYKLRYQLGHWLGELRGISDEHLLQLTDPISVNSKGRATTFRATKYLITHRFLELVYNRTVQGSGIYLPYTHKMTDMTDFEHWYAGIQDITNWLKQEHFTEYSEVRLPSYEEWIALAKPTSDWSFETIRKCNVSIEDDEAREISTVGVFPNSQSQYGCFDVIGNVWELCTDNFQPKIAGWSYKNIYRENWDWKSIRGVTGARGFDIGFRLIVK